MSTLWTINKASGYLSDSAGKQRFAQNLIDIDGIDSDGNLWVDKVEKATLQAGMSLIAGVAPEPQEGAPEGAPAPVADPQAGFAMLDSVIKAMRVSKRYGADQAAPAAEGYPKKDARRSPGLWASSVSNHCGGEAIDITFPFVFNYFDPIIDALALKFGLKRAVKEGKNAEHWHYERVGISSGDVE